MKYRYLLTLLKLSVAAVCMAAIGISQAHAYDHKIYPGSMCVKTGTSGTFGVSSGTVTNSNSTTDLLVECPIIHDQTYILNSIITNGSVVTRDRHYNKNVSCTFNSLYSSGGGLTGAWSPTRSTSGSNPGAQTLSFGSLNPNNSSHYFFSCRIPSTYSGNVSSIISYKITEDGGYE